MSSSLSMGRFEIISLSGSFLLSENNGSRSRTGGLSVSLAGSDGRVLGGGVAGILKAASPVQVVVGSFSAEGKKSKNGPPSASPSNMLNFGGSVTGTGAGPPSPGASSESAEENVGTSPLDHGSGPYTNAGQPMQNMQMIQLPYHFHKVSSNAHPCPPILCHKPKLLSSSSRRVSQFSVCCPLSFTGLYTKREPFQSRATTLMPT
ncbi:AT-hook motif nuclear-localized protein 8 [Sesamum angolense]|uniref:AT-hook motif nuclear-localized protein n=1 Tax=Sesamum angolense TaxID=2727404 RepID=A0AAE1WVF4_9LAMI|nr:AT-hook motif nuclear-localized protein 8 [Sesamum angolense]